MQFARNHLHLSSLVVVVTLQLYSVQTSKADVQIELIKYLRNNITDYDQIVRPRLDPAEPVHVSVTFLLIQIVSVDSAKQSVTIAAFFNANWEEERLVWDSTKFGGVSVMDWDSGKIWFPVIIVYNGIGYNQLLKAQFPVYLTSVSPNTTIVSASWRQDWEFSCSFDMSRFPLDRHTCDMELYMNDMGRGNNMVLPLKGNTLLDPELEYNALAAYVENSEWNLLNLSTFVHYRQYEVFKGLPEIPLPTFVIRMEIERVSTYYMLNVVTPLLLLTLLQVLVFFVPVESGEKLGFGITIMLSYTVFLLLLDGLPPKSQSMPAVASFITAAMVLSASSLLLTSVVIRFHFALETKPMPSCLRVMFVSFLSRLMFCAQRQGNRTEPERDTDDCDTKESDEVERPVTTSGERLSDWKVASVALERLMAIMGCFLTVAIFCVFLLKPLVG